jgi:putative membrane protein
MSTPSGVHFDVQPTASNHFSWVNTVLSLQRTLMAATRTSVSLIGFGFTVAQFFEKVRTTVPVGVRVMRPENPRDFGLALIGAGVISLALFAWQYNVATRHMRSGIYAPLAGDVGRPLLAPVYIVVGAVMLIGVAAFVTIYMRL